MHGGNESNFVAADIEDREFSDLIGVRKGLAQLRARFANRAFRMIAYQCAREDLAPG
jgi:hypothetical protein